MAKLHGPLMSEEARGTIAGNLTFSKRKSGQQVRWQKKQQVADHSAPQKNNQSLYRLIYARWLAMSNSEQDVYNDEARAKNLKMSGWNLFLKRVMSDLSLIGLVGYWTFNEIVNNKISDLSGNGNHGSLLPSYPANSPTLVDSGNKKLGNAANFDGVDDYIDCGDAAALTFSKNDPFSISFAVNPVSIGSNHFIYTKSDGYTGIRVFLLSTGSIRLTLNNVNDEFDFFSRASVSLVPFSELSFVTITYSGNNNSSGIRIYLNSVETTYTASGAPLVGDIVDDSTIKFGHRGIANPKYYRGLLDNMIVHNRVLAPTEAAAIYNLFKK